LLLPLELREHHRDERRGDEARQAAHDAPARHVRDRVRSARPRPALLRGELEHLKELVADAADAVAFSRRADNLLGVVLAHVELEEEVLFPILDRALCGTSRSPILAPPTGSSPSP
jgi:hypothetical protein